MPVVISDFEIVHDPPSESKPENPDSNHAGRAGDKPTTEEILDRLHERQTRVRAH